MDPHGAPLPCCHPGPVGSWCEPAAQRHEPHQSIRSGKAILILVSCSVFQGFCDFRLKVGQRQAVPGQNLNGVSVSRGRSCSISGEGVSFSPELLQCLVVDLARHWHTAAFGAGQRGTSGGAGLAVNPVSGGKPLASAVLGCRVGN